MPLIIPTLTMGFIFSLLALGVAITWRIYEFPDLTVDGSVTTGAAVTVVMLMHHWHPVVATAAGTGAGFICGTATGVLHARFGVNRLLSGILVMSALYSIDLHIMSGSGLALQRERTLVTMADEWGGALLEKGREFTVLGQSVTAGELVMFLITLGILLITLGVLFFLFRSNLGIALRASGRNDRMMRAHGVHTGVMFVLATAVANALAATTGAIFAQYTSSVDIALGAGQIISGLAFVIIGQSLVRARGIGWLLVSAVTGSLVYHVLRAFILLIGDFHNDLRLITAAFVLIALGSQSLLRRIHRGSSIADASLATGASLAADAVLPAPPAVLSADGARAADTRAADTSGEVR